MKNIILTLEAAGCETACLHCWANGRQYVNMELDDMEHIIDEFHKFCSEQDFKFWVSIMNEPLEHPQIIEALKSIKKNLIGYKYEDMYEPIPTSGVPLATREDWADVLENIKELGTNTLWFSFHGIGDIHDKIVNRKGAFEELCTAVERAKSAGFQCGCNVFVTKDSIRQIHDLKDLLKRLEMGTTLIDIGRYEPSKRAVIYDAIRPEVDDLLPIMDVITEINPSWYMKVWDNLNNCTEAAYYNRAVSNYDEEFKILGAGQSDFVEVVCANNLDIYNGAPGVYGKLYGNVKRDKKAAFANLLHDIESNTYAVGRGPSFYFEIDEIPSIAELAQRYGDPNGQKVYPDAYSMTLKWLDRAFEDKRKR